MLIASIPTKISTVFGQNAGPSFIRPIPIPSQISIEAGAASFDTGFPPDTFDPVGAGGTPPFGKDFNGILNQITAWLRWVQAGAPIAYDATFQTDISGYPIGAFVASAVTFGLYFVSTVDGNTTNPDTGGAGWLAVPLASGGVLTTGAWTWRPTQEDLPGWTKGNGSTIGNAGSGATQLASTAAAAQYAWLWTNFANSQCPVSTGRGANPAADFAALKTITVLDMKGMQIVGMDTMGGAPTTRLAGVPITYGSPTQAGSVLGEVLHALITAELATHNHGVNDSGHAHGVADSGHAHGSVAAASVVSLSPAFTPTNPMYVNASGGTTASQTTGIGVNSNTTGVTTQNNGSGTAHNNTGLVMAGTHYFKL